jgi:hypothetical protein
MIANHFQIRSLCAFVALSLTFFCGTAQVRAGSIDPSKIPIIVVQSNGDPNTQIFKPDANAYAASGSDGDFALTGEMDLGGFPSASVKVQELQFNNDPFVLNNFLVTNNLGVPQLFTVFVGLPTTVAAPNTISGNVRTSVIDGGNDGASISTLAGSGAALYQARVDSTTVASLQSDPFILAAPAGLSASASATFGPTVSNVPGLFSIGIQLQFTLTPGDTAAILSRFDIVPGTGGGLPEPTTLALGGLMALIAGGFRRVR